MTLPKNFDLKHFEIFIAVADTRSMRRAAAQFGVTQAAVSQTIFRLEEAVGAPLLDRTNRPFKLTASGSFVLERARAIVAETRILHQALQSRGQGSESELRLSILDSVFGALMPDLLHNLRTGSPVGKLTLLSGLVDRNLAALSDGIVDLVITTDDDSGNPGLPVIPLLRERLVTVTPIGYPAVGLEGMARGGGHLGFPPDSSLGRMIERQMRRLRITLQSDVIFDRSETLFAAISDGQGWTIATPLCLLASRVDPAAILVHPISERMEARKIAVMARPHEMSVLNTRTARVIRETAQTILPNRLSSYAPWLADAVEFSELAIPSQSQMA